MKRFDEGSAMVETALVLPVMVLLFAGVAELGLAVYDHHQLSKAVRDAARFLARVPDPTAAEYQAMATNYMRTGSFAGTGSALVGTDPSKISVSYTIQTIDNTAKTWNGPDTLWSVHMEATYPFRSYLLKAVGLAGPDGLPLKVGHTERHIGE